MWNMWTCSYVDFFSPFGGGKTCVWRRIWKTVTILQVSLTLGIWEHTSSMLTYFILGSIFGLYLFKIFFPITIYSPYTVFHLNLPPSTLPGLYLFQKSIPLLSPYLIMIALFSFNMVKSFPIVIFKIHLVILASLLFQINFRLNIQHFKNAFEILFALNLWIYFRRYDILTRFPSEI